MHRPRRGAAGAPPDASTTVKTKRSLPGRHRPELQGHGRRTAVTSQGPCEAQGALPAPLLPAAPSLWHLPGKFPMSCLQPGLGKSHTNCPSPPNPAATQRRRRRARKGQQGRGLETPPPAGTRPGARGPPRNPALRLPGDGGPGPARFTPATAAVSSTNWVGFHGMDL